MQRNAYATEASAISTKTVLRLTLRAVLLRLGLVWAAQVMVNGDRRSIDVEVDPTLIMPTTVNPDWITAGEMAGARRLGKEQAKQVTP
jgi:hypothetical protein